MNSPLLSVEENRIYATGCCCSVRFQGLTRHTFLSERRGTQFFSSAGFRFYDILIRRRAFYRPPYPGCARNVVSLLHERLCFSSRFVAPTHLFIRYCKTPVAAAATTFRPNKMSAHMCNKKNTSGEFVGFSPIRLADNEFRRIAK